MTTLCPPARLRPRIRWPWPRLWSLTLFAACLPLLAVLLVSAFGMSLLRCLHDAICPECGRPVVDCECEWGCPVGRAAK